MFQVLVIGGGLSGCTVARELAENGVNVTIVEKEGRIGGKVRSYGCKATDKCNNCGVCLSGGLWENVERNSNIEIISCASLADVTGGRGDFSAAVKTPAGIRYINGISAIVVATGFEETPASYGHLQIEGSRGIIRVLELEAIFKARSKDALFERAPQNVAFIQCVGSRDKKDGAMYCSRVCCSYSTRAAKVIRQYYPDCAITFFYMELQAVSNGDYFLDLSEHDIEFVKCRPLKISGGEPATLEFEDPESGKMIRREFDAIVLSDGIHPPKDADLTAELCGLGQDKNGFFKGVGKSSDSGVFISGCAKWPGKIEETYSDSVAVAKEIIAEWRRI